VHSFIESDLSSDSIVLFENTAHYSKWHL